MLELRPNCECCGKDLPPNAEEAVICSFECTFCTVCSEQLLSNTCPHCGGNLSKRPIRPKEALKKYPASAKRIMKDDCRRAKRQTAALEQDNTVSNRTTSTQMDQQTIARQLALLNNPLNNTWTLRNNRIKKDFVFSNFKQALNFMVRVGRHADDLDHHPEWSNIYNKVSVALTTHSAGGVTDLDFKLALKIESEYGFIDSK